MDKSSFLADISKIVAGAVERQIKPRFEFDVRVLNIASVEFQFEVIKTGCVIFSRDKSKRVYFEFKVISAYLDMRYMYDILDRKFLVRI